MNIIQPNPFKNPFISIISLKKIINSSLVYFKKNLKRRKKYNHRGNYRQANNRNNYVYVEQVSI